VPDVPDVPDVPYVPHVPDVPDVPYVPDVPHLAGLITALLLSNHMLLFVDIWLCIQLNCSGAKQYYFYLVTK
jgi:hypothetical protein